MWRTWILLWGAVCLGMAPGIRAEALTHHGDTLSPQHRAALAQAREWLSQGRSQVAYGLLQPLEPQLSGLVDFDLVYGQAALGADQPSIAAFAFERCLAVAPRHGLCRLGMVRAHIALREARSAGLEMEHIRKSRPPAAIQKAMERYKDLLAGIEEPGPDTRLSSYVQVGVGYDSNINNATSSTSMAIPAFNDLEMLLSRDGRSQESAFGELRFHMNYSRRLSTDWRLLAQANVNATGYNKTSRYHTMVSDFSLGAMRSADKHRLIGRLLAQNYRLANHSYRNTLGFLGQYTYSLTDRADISLFVQASRLNYQNSRRHPSNHLRTANRYSLGASWSQGLANGRAVVYTTAYGGTSKTTKRQAPRSYDYRFEGLRAGGMYLLGPRLQLEAGAGAERRKYRGKDQLYLKRRDDTFYDAYLGLNYAINRKLSLRPQYRYYKNDANMTLYGYKRHVFTVNLRYDLF